MGGGGGSLSPLSAAGRRRLLGPQEPGQYYDDPTFNPEPLEERLMSYTASSGRYPLGAEEQALLKPLIESAPSTTATLFRVENASVTENLQVGDTFSRDIQSWSKSPDFVSSVAGTRANQAVLQTVGSQKSLNIQGYSYYGRQYESLTLGTFRVVNIRQQSIGNRTVRVMEVEQTS